MVNENNLPSNSDLYLKYPLYTPLGLSYLDSTEQAEYIESVEYPKETIDAYCVECEQESIFEPSEVSDKVSIMQAAQDCFNDLPSRFKRDQDIYRPREKETSLLTTRIFPVSFDCTRSKEHRAFFLFRFSQGILTKIGQHPSIADAGLPQISQYKKILGEEKLSELYMAIGLASHGIGIGAFVYLRRIFEVLIQSAHSTARQNRTWDEVKYDQTRHTDKKIQLLKDYLPSLLVQERKLLSILSKGIHELNDDECKAHFDLIRSGIELILNEELERQNKQQAAKQFRQDLNKLNKELKAK